MFFSKLNFSKIGFFKVGFFKVGFFKNLIFQNWIFSELDFVENWICLEMSALAPPPGNDANSFTCTLKLDCARLRWKGVWTNANGSKNEFVKNGFFKIGFFDQKIRILLFKEIVFFFKNCYFNMEFDRN